jgi:hypothetical protein
MSEFSKIAKHCSNKCSKNGELRTAWLFSAYAEREQELSRPLREKNHGKNYIRSDFLGSDTLIIAVTIIWAVGYNSNSTLFTMNLNSLRIGITIIATNSYGISELQLQALREIVTISQSWNYKHRYNYLQCIIVGITIIRARNSYNISDCNQTLALIRVVVHRGGVTCISYRHQLSGCWLQQLLLPIAADLSADRNIIQDSGC